MQTHAERFRQMMQEWGLTQEELGNLCGIKRGTVGTIVNGKTVPDVEALARLKQAKPTLRWDWLLLGSGPMTTGDPTPPASAPESKPRFTTAAETVEEASALVKLAATEAENTQLKERLEDAKAEIAWLRGKSYPSSYAAATEQPRMEIRRWHEVIAETPTQECKHFILDPAYGESDVLAA